MLRGTIGRRAICAAVFMAMAMPAAAAAHPGAGVPSSRPRQGAARGSPRTGPTSSSASRTRRRRWARCAGAPPAPARALARRRATATAYGGRCPQLPSTNGAGSENEDCLYLNVFRPAGERRAPAARCCSGSTAAA